MSDVLLALSGMAALKYGVLSWLHRAKPPSAVCVGRVATITLYPVKSCAGISLTQAQCTNLGLLSEPAEDTFVRDRHFMITDETSKFMCMRLNPSLALVQPSFHGNMMHLNAPGMETLKVPAKMAITNNSKIVSCRVWDDEVQGLHCGQEASDWLSQYLKKPAHLVYSEESIQKRHLLEIGSSYWHKITRPWDKVAYADLGPYLLLSMESVADLNTRINKPVTYVNFRPNITVEGCTAYDEDSWNEIFIGNSKLVNLKLCTRCSMTTVDPETGIKDSQGEPLKTLTRYRIKPSTSRTQACLGVNLFTDLEGAIQVGDTVYVTRHQTD